MSDHGTLVYTVISVAKCLKPIGLSPVTSILRTSLMHPIIVAAGKVSALPLTGMIQGWPSLKLPILKLKNTLLQTILIL